VGTASNVVVVDWSRLGNPALGNPLWYPVAASHVPIVGKRIGELIKWLWNIGGISDPSHVHCVGHSLGAHVSAEAGNYVQALGSSIGRISGLDPAGENFKFHELTFSPTS
jgi:pancreatic triacylglycerol lipase